MDIAVMYVIAAMLTAVAVITATVLDAVFIYPSYYEGVDIDDYFFWVVALIGSSLLWPVTWVLLLNRLRQYLIARIGEKT